MRESGATFREIGEAFGVGIERARQLVFVGNMLNSGRLKLPERYLIECLDSIANGNPSS